MIAFLIRLIFNEVYPQGPGLGPLLFLTLY